MAVNQHMARGFPILPHQEIRTEAKNGFHVFRAGHHPVRRRRNDIVETQRRAVVLAIGAESFQFREFRIDDRQNVGHVSAALPRKFLDTANGQHGRKGRFHVHYPCIGFMKHLPALRTGRAKSTSSIIHRGAADRHDEGWIDARQALRLTVSSAGGDDEAVGRDENYTCAGLLGNLDIREQGNSCAPKRRARKPRPFPSGGGPQPSARLDIHDTGRCRSPAAPPTGGRRDGVCSTGNKEGSVQCPV
ncbi:hypothetical protein D9M70_468080 [compost metagenome]